MASPHDDRSADKRAAALEQVRLAQKTWERERKALEEQRRKIDEVRRRAIQDALDIGLSMTEVGVSMGLSRGRVSQIRDGKR